jgi:hypothetical protein
MFKEIYKRLLGMKDVAILDSTGRLLAKGQIDYARPAVFSVGDFEFNLWNVKSIFGTFIEIEV